jgi:DNA-binding LacI/PurR family transcriptional regulator
VPRNFVKPEKRIEARRRVEEIIREGELWGRRLAGEPLLAAELGISRGTLRAALAELEADGILERRHGAGTFVTGKPGARGARRTTQIAVIASTHCEEDPEWNYYGEMVLGLQALAPRMRAACTVLAYDREEDSARIWDRREMRAFDAFVSVAIEHHDLMSHLVDLGRGPVVLVDHYLKDLPIVGVVDGGFEAARATTRHLLALGHRRVAFVDCFNSALYNPERIAGYRAALARKGMAVDEELIVPQPRMSREMTASGWEDFAEGTVERLMNLKERPTAIFAFDDTRALRLARALEKRGLRPGENFSLAGCGDTAIRRGVCDWLTSARIYPRKMGRAALRAALGRRESGGGRTVIVPNRLYIRRSTCPPLK